MSRTSYVFIEELEKSWICNGDRDPTLVLFVDRKRFKTHFRYNFTGRTQFIDLSLISDVEYLVAEIIAFYFCVNSALEKVLQEFKWKKVDANSKATQSVINQGDADGVQED